LVFQAIPRDAQELYLKGLPNRQCKIAMAVVTVFNIHDLKDGPETLQRPHGKFASCSEESPRGSKMASYHILLSAWFARYSPRGSKDRPESCPRGPHEDPKRLQEVPDDPTMLSKCFPETVYNSTFALGPFYSQDSQKEALCYADPLPAPLTEGVDKTS